MSRIWPSILRGKEIEGKGKRMWYAWQGERTWTILAHIWFCNLEQWHLRRDFLGNPKEEVSKLKRNCKKPPFLSFWMSRKMHLASIAIGSHHATSGEPVLGWILYLIELKFFILSPKHFINLTLKPISLWGFSSVSLFISLFYILKTSYFWLE